MSLPIWFQWTWLSGEVDLYRSCTYIWWFYLTVIRIASDCWVVSMAPVNSLTNAFARWLYSNLFLKGAFCDSLWAFLWRFLWQLFLPGRLEGTFLLVASLCGRLSSKSGHLHQAWWVPLQVKTFKCWYFWEELMIVCRRFVKPIDRSGWSGPKCKQCKPRQGCKHGTCSQVLMKSYKMQLI